MLGAGELGIDEELERVGLLVLLHEPIQRGATQPGQRATGGVAQQARLDDLQGEGVIALADEGGSGGGERLFPAWRARSSAAACSAPVAGSSPGPSGCQ